MQLMSAFKTTVEECSGVPLSQKECKKCLAMTLDKLIPLLKYKKKELCLCANGISDFSEKLQYLEHDKFESLIDLTVYENDKDPFVCVLSAESEAFPSHDIEKDSTSDNSDYLWDFFKLLHVPSPFRIFLARTTMYREHEKLDRVKTLQDRLQSFTEMYNQTCLSDGDKIFTIVLPTAKKHYSHVECRGYQRINGILGDVLNPGGRP
jgi:hypothetical protein